MRLFALLLLCLAVAPAPAASWQSLSPPVDVSCDRDATSALDCSYRTLDGRAVSEIRASADGAPLTVEGGGDYPWPGALTAVLAVIDTSDPGREPVVRSNQGQVAALVAAAKPHHVFGLASFDSGLHVAAPVGSPPPVIAEAAGTLNAQGMTTELYRSLLQAIDVLKGIRADRRLIVVFSDGQAEDRAYFHQDVVRAARENGIVISSLGFARSLAQSVALQTLRRLSEETGGIYIDAGTSLRLPDDFAGRLLGNIDSGGRFSVDTSSAAGDVEISFVPVRGPAFRVRVPAPAGAPVAALPPAPAPAAAAPPAAEPPTAVQIVTSEPERRGIDTLLWYGVPLSLVVLVILTVFMLVLLSRRQAPAPAAATTPVRPLAYLVRQDERGTRYPVTGTIWRIGRGRDNELVLDDNSISRRHAELQRGADGRFTLLDKNSLNGVFVNGEKVGRRELNEGDLIELGDIVLRFTEASADDLLSEQTSVQHTRAPHFN